MARISRISVQSLTYHDWCAARQAAWTRKVRNLLKTNGRLYRQFRQVIAHEKISVPSETPGRSTAGRYDISASALPSLRLAAETCGIPEKETAEV